MSARGGQSHNSEEWTLSPHYLCFRRGLDLNYLGGPTGEILNKASLRTTRTAAIPPFLCLFVIPHSCLASELAARKGNI